LKRNEIATKLRKNNKNKIKLKSFTLHLF